jgi:hypothetical protein
MKFRIDNRAPVLTASKKAPTPITIYDLYEKYAKPPSEGGVLSERSIRSKEGTHAPGTLKRSGDRYYCIALEQRDAYYNFCKKLFTKGQTGLLGTAFQQNLAAPLVVPTFR